MLYDMIIKKINYKCEDETAGYSASYYRDLITLSLKFIYIAKAIFIKPHEWNSYMWNANTKSWRRDIQYIPRNMHTVFALLCFVVVIHLTDFPYPSGLLHWHCGNLAIAPVPAKATLMNIDKYFMWIHYERLHNHNKAKHNKTVCIFLGIYCNENSLPTHIHRELVSL